MGSKSKLAALFLLTFSTCAALSIFANNQVIREHVFSAEGINEIEIEASVGSIEIILSDKDEIELILDIESQRHGWFWKRKRDLEDVDLESRTRGDKLSLKQTQDDTHTDWIIRMPAFAKTSIELGVGQIDAEFGATEVDIELGVGDIDILMPKASTALIDLEVGVGDADVQGARNINSEKNFISKELSAHGDGDKNVNIEIGVGDINLVLR